MKAAVFLLLVACGVRVPKLERPTAAEACDRAAECGVSLPSREACEFCVECLVKVNGSKLEGVLVDAQSVACPTAVKWWDQLLAKCASEWVPGSRCGNSKGEEVRR